MQQTILIVEDEPSIRDMVKFALQGETFNVIEAGSVAEAERILFNQIPDLILLDWMLPQTSGIKYARRLKKDNKTQDIPIIMLTAKAEEDYKVKGLEAGADDYITKPFSPRELIARIKTVLRRGPLKSPEGIIKVDNITIDSQAHQVSINNASIKLSPIEFKLLYFFASHQGRTYSREQLLHYIWGGDTDIDERTVDVQILRLRKELKKHCDLEYIQTVHGIGYKFNSNHNLDST